MNSRPARLEDTVPSRDQGWQLNRLSHSPSTGQWESSFCSEPPPALKSTGIWSNLSYLMFLMVFSAEWQCDPIFDVVYHWSETARKGKQVCLFETELLIHSAPVSLCSPERQQGCEDPDWASVRGHEWVGAHSYCMCSVSVCVCQKGMFRTVWCVGVCVRVCVLFLLTEETGLQSELDSVIGSRENPNEAMSISAPAPLPGAPGRRPPPPRPQPI